MQLARDLARPRLQAHRHQRARASSSLKHNIDVGAGLEGSRESAPQRRRPDDQPRSDAGHQHPARPQRVLDDTYIRKIALQLGIPCITTLSAATACVEGIRSMREGVSTIAALQEQHSGAEALKRGA